MGFKPDVCAKGISRIVQSIDWRFLLYVTRLSYIEDTFNYYLGTMPPHLFASRSERGGIVVFSPGRGIIMVARKHKLVLTAIGFCLILTSCDSADEGTFTDNVITLRKANATSFSIDGGTDASYNQSIKLI